MKQPIVFVDYDFDCRSIAEMVIAAGETAINSGFRAAGEIRPVEESKLLLLSELSEALEELRNGVNISATYFNEDKPGKPEGVIVEIADYCIRCFDILHSLGYIPMGSQRLRFYEIPESPIKFLSFLSTITEKAFEENEIPYYPAGNGIDKNALIAGVIMCGVFFEKIGVNFYGVIREKMGYNRKRPFKHGREF